MRAKTQYRIEKVVFFPIALSFIILWSPWLAIFVSDLFDGALISTAVMVIVYLISLSLVFWFMIRWYYPHEKKLKELAQGSETELKKMRPSQLEKAQGLDRGCVRKKYKGC